MADEIVRVIVKDAPVKAMAITGRELTERARQIHKTLPVVTAALVFGGSLAADLLYGVIDPRIRRGAART